MGDYSDFCESFGRDPSNPEFMDNWLDNYASGNKPVARHISKTEEKNFISDYKLTNKEWHQVKAYVFIFKKNALKKHHEVNNYITNNNLWGNFSELRSMNDHGSNKVVHGITEKHFKLICEILNITGDNGAPLIKAERY